MADKVRSGFLAPVALFGVAALFALNVAGYAWLIDGSRLRREDAHIFLMFAVFLSLMVFIYSFVDRPLSGAHLNGVLVHLHFWPMLSVVIFSLYFATHVGVIDARSGEIHRSSPILFRLATTNEILFGLAQIPFFVNLALLLRQRMKSRKGTSS